MHVAETFIFEALFRLSWSYSVKMQVQVHTLHILMLTNYFKALILLTRTIKKKMTFLKCEIKCMWLKRENAYLSNGDLTPRVKTPTIPYWAMNKAQCTSLIMRQNNTVEWSVVKQINDYQSWLIYDSIWSFTSRKWRAIVKAE